MADKPSNADKVKANKANKVEADEADAINDAVEAIVTKEIKASVIDKIVAANKAAEANTANKSSWG